MNTTKNTPSGGGRTASVDARSRRGAGRSLRRPRFVALEQIEIEIFQRRTHDDERPETAMVAISGAGNGWIKASCLRSETPPTDR